MGRLCHARRGPGVFRIVQPWARLPAMGVAGRVMQGEG